MATAGENSASATQGHFVKGLGSDQSPHLCTGRRTQNS